MFTIKYDNNTFDLNEIRKDADISIQRFLCTNSSQSKTIEIIFSATEIAYCWHPLKNFDSSIKPDWSKSRTVSLIESAPIECFFNYKGENIFTIGLSELIKPIHINSGICEEDGTISIKINLDEITYKDKFDIYINTQKKHFSRILGSVSKWWEENLNIFPITNKHRRCMYSTWYSYHQNITDKELVENIENLKKYKFSAIILDDGWQTADNNRGYSFCGDWEVTSSKFENFHNFVDTFHKNDLDVIVWFSVPYIGENSNLWKKFESRFLYHDRGRKAAILDIRYQENIDYLIDVYLCFAKKYSIDGLKLDFIDEFYLRKNSPAYNSGMTYKSVHEALDSFLKKLTNELLAWRSDFFIEFRQKYIGPQMRQYSNAFRVIDSPYSAISNRVGIVDIRLINGETPVHSDMIMWNKDDSPEIVSLQIIACLFGTIQFSFNFSDQSSEQQKVITNYINFSNENVHLLQEKSLYAFEPEHLYPHVFVSDLYQEIHVLYAPQKVVSIGDKKATIINGTLYKELFLESNVQKTAKIFKCTGDYLCTEKIKCGLNKIMVPPGGMLIT